MLTKARFFSTVFPALIMGLVFLNLQDNQQGVQGKVGCLFFCIMNQTMQSLFGVLQAFPQEKPILLR